MLLPFSRNASIPVAVALLILFSAWPNASATRFGRNKIQYERFDWEIVKTEHFDVYYYSGLEDLAEAVTQIVEESNDSLEEVLNHELSTTIPVIIYASHNEFQQTNVLSSHVGEGVGGFMELFKNRVVIPFTGSYDELRHVIHHELTHVFMFDIVYRGLAESVIRQAYFNPVELWFTEGLAEYASQGWDTNAEMMIRDMVISDVVIPLEYLFGGYAVYKEGQSVFVFIAEQYGSEKVSEIVHDLARTQNLDRTLRETLGLKPAELSREWEEWLKRSYWPEVAERSRLSDTAKLLTDHRSDHSYFNRGPVVSPDGMRVVFASDKSGYADVYVASTLDGAILKHLIKGERTDAFEQLHLLRTGFSWSPDETQICIAAKAGDSDAIHILDADTGGVLRSLTFSLDGLYTPAWSPDGKWIAFVGIKGGASELYLTDPTGGRLYRLTDDFSDERDPAWSPDSRFLAFTSDRGSPIERGFHRSYDLYTIDVESRDVTPIVRARGRELSPTWSPDGRKLIYSSDRDGSSELYMVDLDDSTCVALTNLIGGAESPNWSREGDRLVFTGYERGGWDVAVVKDPLTHFADEIGSDALFPSTEPELGTEPFDETGWRGVLEAPDEETITDGGESETADTTGISSGDETEVVRLAREAYDEATGSKPHRSDEASPDRAGVVERYTPRFSPDWIDGGVSYSSAHGMGAAVEIAVSDILGNHRFHVVTDFFSSIEFSNAHLSYEYLAGRINYSAGVYTYRHYLYSDRTLFGEDLGEKRYFTERHYGVSLGLCYAFSRFSRVEFDVDGLSMARRFAEENEDGEIELTDEGVKRTLVIPTLRFVNDTTLWGRVGPIGGGRSSFMVTKSLGLNEKFDYLTGIADFRKYIRIGARHSLAMKLVYARSTQPDAQTFFMGGTNSIRGHDDFEFSGHNTTLASFELRYPFVDRLDVASPLPLSIRGLRGVMFVDLGAAWDADRFRGIVDDEGTRFKDIKAGYGVGVRTQFMFFILRYDLAWSTDLKTRGEPVSHFSIGAEF
jgi:Tol biopolymer transport system component